MGFLGFVQRLKIGVFRPEEKTVDEKIEEALVGVADESGLKKMIDTDEESEAEEEPEEERELCNFLNKKKTSIFNKSRYFWGFGHSFGVFLNSIFLMETLKNYNFQFIGPGRRLDDKLSVAN